MRLLLLSLMGFIISCSSANKKPAESDGTVRYEVDGTQHVGYIASKTKKGEKKPAVLVVHEWWGHNAYTRKRADLLAEAGYVAMSIDMYGEGKTADHPDDAGAFAQKAMSDFPLAKKRFEKALEILKSRPDVDPEKISAIGYCFGGGVVLNMARAGVDLDLIASFHGSLDGPVKAKKGVYKPKTLVFNGKDDGFVSAKSIQSLQKEMKAAGVKLTFKNYEGARHGFTNPDATEVGKKYNMPLEYNAVADEDSWKTLLAELARL
jgi:dienelactone hydrolase